MSQRSEGSGDYRLQRVRVVVGGERVPLWIARLLDDLAKSGSVEFLGVSVALGVNSGDACTDRVSLGRGIPSVAWADVRVFARSAALLRPVELGDWCDGSHSSPGRADIVLDLTGGRPSRDAWETTGGSVWWLSGVPTGLVWPGIERPEIAAAVIEGRQTISFELAAQDRKQRNAVILAKATCPTHTCSPLMTAAYMAGTALRLIVKEIERVAVDGRPHTVATERPGEPTPNGVRLPWGSPECDSRPAQWPAPAYIGRVAAWGARRIGWVRQWYLLVGDGELERPAVDPADLSPVMPPSGHFWADPFVVADGASAHVFFEDFEYKDRKGRISVLTFDGAGRYGPAHRVLEADSHLSYPFVFRHDNRLFMIPESAAAGTVDLYECVDLPLQWVFRRSLLNNVHLVDASVVEWQGLWWMFASLELPPGLRGSDILVLYVAADPVTGDWREHPASPLLVDVTGSRPAGAPFVCEGSLYRPSQDGTRGYGWGIVVNEVLSLTPAHYRERPVAMVSPDFAKRSCGFHTMNRAGGKVVMDACRWIPRLQSPWPRSQPKS